MFGSLVSLLALAVAVFAVWEARTARRESIPRPLCERHGADRIRLYYPAEMALQFGIDAVACPDGHELKRWDFLTIEQAASLPLQEEKGTKLHYSPSASDITVGVQRSCRKLSVRCRMLSQPSFRIDHTLGI